MPQTRRQTRARFLILGFILASFLSVPGLINPRTAFAATAVTTDSLNLRVGFRVSSKVKLVMPAGSVVEIVNRSQNGYWKVVYEGVRGYAHGDYLDFSGGGGSSSGDNGSTGNATTTSSLNLRAGPSTADRVLLVMPSGASVSLTGESQSGFLRLTYQGTTGWASSTYISTGGGSGDGSADPGSGNAGSARTTSSLRLRSGPSTSSSVILTMPSGASVTLTGSAQNGFSGVVYQGTSGWAATDYLTTLGGDSGTVDPGSGNGGSATTTSSLRLRSGPSTSASVILTMPAGATVTLTGSSENGFLGVVYQGTSGWASADYLSTGGGGGGGGGSVMWPFESGGSWEIIQGYNGGTHNGTMYRFSLDLVKSGGGTAGSSILAPVSGTVVWNDVSSGGIAIDMGNGYTMCMFHVTFSSSLTRGTYVTQGQWLGTISPPGGPGYAVTPHVDMTLWYTGGGGRVSAPFSGGFAISGYDFPESGSYNAYGGTVIYP